MLRSRNVSDNNGTRAAMTKACDQLPSCPSRPTRYSIRLRPACHFVFAVSPGSPQSINNISSTSAHHLPAVISPHPSIDQMSALAARRAALAAKAAIAAEAPPVPSKPATRSTQPAKAAPKPPPSPTLSDFSGVSDDESDDSDSAGPSSKRRKVANKGKKSSENKEKESRYFAGVEIPTRSKPEASKPRKRRAFSPSAAMEEMEDGTSEESSGDEAADEPVQEEVVAPWSGAPSPWEPRPQTWVHPKNFWNNTNASVLRLRCLVHRFLRWKRMSTLLP